MAVAPVPVPVAAAEAAPATPAPEAMGELFSTYDPSGALGGMFAPAFIKGFQPSEQAVASWTRENRPVTQQNVEDTRIWPEWRDQSVSGASDQYGGGRIPLNLDYTGRGAVDPEALRVLAQGGKYDWNARRNAIAQRFVDIRNARGW